MVRAFNNVVYSVKEITEAKQYLLHGALPIRKTDQGLINFQTRYDTPGWSVSDKGELVFKGKVIVPPGRVQTELDLLYSNPALTINSIQRFTDVVKRYYHNISRRRVEAFLKSKPSYQMVQPYKKPVRYTRPIRSSYVLERVQLDIIGPMPRNGHFKYILTAIDHFSKMAFAWPLHNKTAALVTAKVADLFENQLDTKPTVIQTDNGGEFKSVFDDWCNDNGVLHIMSHSYTPQSQGAVERFNRTLKEMLWSFMAQRNNKQWVGYLFEALANYNNRIHTTTKKTPISVFFADDREDEEVRENIEVGITKMLAKNKKPLPPLQKGDKVRIHLSQFEKKEHANLSKKYKPQWSEIVFTIYKKMGDFYQVEFDGRYYATQYNRQALLKVL